MEIRRNRYRIDKYMEQIIILILLILPFACLGKDINKVDSIVVLYAGWYKETDVNVSCKSFEKAFKSTGYISTDISIIDKLQRRIERLKPSGNPVIDVRCKIYFYFSGELLATMCLDRFHALYDGKYYKTSKKLLALINNIMEKEVRYDIVPKAVVEDSIVSDKTVLINYMDSISDILNLNQSEELRGYCIADKEGNIIKISIRQKDSGTKIPQCYIEKIEDIYKKTIKWTPDKERMKTDRIPIRIVF